MVGGSVRDGLTGRDVADVDLATPEVPEAVITALETAGLKAVPTGIKHGTVTAVSDHRAFEVTTLRRDVTTDGRHAEVAWTDDWEVDAARRDFTINAMSMTRDGAVFDYFGGRADLAAGRVRFVGEPAARIAEDYLRILRFFRFQARYGQQEPDHVTVAALRGGVDGLARLSPERVWSEFKRILVAPEPGRSIRLMQELGVLGAILPTADIAGLDRVAAGPAGGSPAAGGVAAGRGDRRTLAVVGGRAGAVGGPDRAGHRPGIDRAGPAACFGRHVGGRADRALLAYPWR